MKKVSVLLLLSLLLFSLAACRARANDNRSTPQLTPEETTSAADAAGEGEPLEELPSETAKNKEDDMNHDTVNAETSPETSLQMNIGDTAVSVEWESNESVTALAELVKDEPLAVQMSMYGGFEQVGSLGTNLPRNDVQTVTQAGDIVLYSGNQIVVFYGSNSWAYTRLGHITDKTADELAELLGSGDVIITISQGE